MEPRNTDVVVVGGSIAGCATAALLGRLGAGVTVLEKAPKAGHYKVMCTHFLQPGASPVLRRLGVEEQLIAAGAVPNRTRVWVRYGWFMLHAEGEHGWNIRRSKLDPMLRALAVGTDGVTFESGVTVDEVLRDGEGRPCGVRGRRRNGERLEVRAQVVVGADGRGSDVARLAGVPGRVLPNRRIGYMAYYEGLEVAAAPDSMVWFQDPEVRYAFPNDDGIVVLAVFTTADRAPEFRADSEAAFMRSFDGLPDGPDIGAATRVSPVTGKLDMANVRRPAARPGIAFVGDAAQASDPLWGVGCGFALQTAEWLTDEIGPALSTGGSVDRALGSYARKHRSALLGHHLLTSEYSSGRRFNPLERLLYSTAPHHPPTAELLGDVGGRGRPLHHVMTPPRIARSAGAALRHAMSG
jgi:flavin-dependent dehydrogenase